VAATVTHRDRVLARDLVEVVDIERALVLHLGVVEEEALDPEARRRRAGALTQLLDDAGDRDELDLIGVADHHVVQQDRAGRVIVGVDEARHDRHLPGVEGSRAGAD
jgi:hypothetical protein